MLFLVQDYLASLKEREELDAILPDLLRAMGFQTVKLAFRGEVEHGVDIAAIGREDGETVLYLIQVKAGDIDAEMWDSGRNAIRPTLNNLLDVPFEDLTQPRLREARRKAILAHNGHLRENIRERFNGYIEKTFERRMAFARWGLDDLAFRFQEYLLNERILPKEQQRLLKRTLVFLDVPLCFERFQAACSRDSGRCQGIEETKTQQGIWLHPPCPGNDKSGVSRPEQSIAGTCCV